MPPSKPSAFKCAACLEDMASAEVSPSGTLRADGGLTRSSYFLQLQSDILGLPVRGQTSNI